MELPESYWEGVRQKDKISDIPSPKLSSLFLDISRTGNKAVSIFFTQNMPRRVSSCSIIDRPHVRFSLGSITLTLEKKCLAKLRILLSKRFSPHDVGSYTREGE